MADYYPLLTRALDALTERSPAMRRAVYDRARAALMDQLRNLEPPLSEGDIARERLALEDAVNRVERAHPSLIGGCGIYSGTSAHGPFTHIDTRGYPARWIGTGDS